MRAEKNGNRCQRNKLYSIRHRVLSAISMWCWLILPFCDFFSFSGTFFLSLRKLLFVRKRLFVQLKLKFKWSQQRFCIWNVQTFSYLVLLLFYKWSSLQREEESMQREKRTGGCLLSQKWANMHISMGYLFIFCHFFSLMRFDICDYVWHFAIWICINFSHCELWFRSWSSALVMFSWIELNIGMSWKERKRE